MFGFIIGTASLLGLIYVLRGGGCGHRHRGWHGGYGGYGRRHGWGRWGILDGLFDRIGATRSQEDEIRSAVDELFRAARDFKEDMLKTREDVARAMKADAFDETLMGEVFGKQDDALDKLRKSVVGALAKAHSVLDERQRERLADLISGGFRRGFYGGPYRNWT